jgi:ABC-type multidrug transport system fused ATPase/permease subunit
METDEGHVLKTGNDKIPPPREVEMPAGMPLPSPEKVPYRKLFRWGWFVVSVALGWFLANTVLTIFVNQLTLYMGQVLATVVSGLERVAGHSVVQTASQATGFWARFLPLDIKTAAILFGAIAAVLIPLGFADRLLKTWTDNLMTARLQQRLHDKLLTLGPVYHRSHNVGETMLIVTQFSMGAQTLLRALISFPVVQGTTLVTAMFYLVHNLNQVGNTPLWTRLALLGALLILPLGGWFLAGRLRQAFTKVRESQIALADEFSNSASSPLEVQLMRAEEQRSQAFGERIRIYMRLKLAAAWRNEVANQFQESTPIFLQTVFLIYGVFFAMTSAHPQEAAGAILAIYIFVPAAVHPMQEIIMFVTGLSTTWPQVERVMEVLETEAEVKDRPGAVELSPREGQVVLENVSFSHNPQTPLILNNLNYTFPPGQVTAVVAKA